MALMRTGTAAALSMLLLGSAPTLALAKAHLNGDRIIISGGGNTLLSVARDIADAEVFSFDPERNAALSNRNLLIEGVFSIGNDEPPDTLSPYSEILEMNISRCGAVRIEVGRSAGGEGQLDLRRAKLTTIHEIEDECSEPNLLILRGKLTADHSEISGNIGCVIEPGSSAEIVGSTICYSPDSALTCELQEGQHLDIRNSAFIDNANYGMRIGRCPGGLEIRDSVFRGLAADVFNSAGGEIALTDCDFASVKFGSLSGKVITKWSVTVQGPRAGLHVVAESAPRNPRRETVRGVTDTNGVCHLTLTEYVAFPPRAKEFQEGVNNVTPHIISVYDGDGKTLLYRMANFHVFMKGQKARFR